MVPVDLTTSFTASGWQVKALRLSLQEAFAAGLPNGMILPGDGRIQIHS